LKAFNRALKNVQNNQDHFGGTMILLNGDFRQTPSVILKSIAADEINTCLTLSNL